MKSKMKKFILCLTAVGGLLLFLFVVLGKSDIEQEPFSWETWNTWESIDRSEERLARYESLKQQYFPEDRPKGYFLWSEEAAAVPLQTMFGSDICAVVTVTEGCERSDIENKRITDKIYTAYQELIGNPGTEPLSPEQIAALLQKRPSLMWDISPGGWEESFEVKVEKYLFDRTKRYLDTLTIQKRPESAWYSFGHIHAYQGLQMVVFLNVTDSGKGIGDLRWNYFISEDQYIVPMTEDYGDYREYSSENDGYVGMWEYGGYRLEDYLEVVRAGYHGYECEKNSYWTIYEYLNQKLTPAAKQPINGSVITNAWEVIKKEVDRNIERYQIIALVEDFWIDEALQQRIGIGTLELERKTGGTEYTVKTEEMEWWEADVERGELTGSFSKEDLMQMAQVLTAQEAEFGEEKAGSGEGQEMTEKAEEMTKEAQEKEQPEMTEKMAEVSKKQLRKKQEDLIWKAKRNLESFRMRQGEERRYEKMRETSV